jgi:hypothetical protein
MPVSMLSTSLITNPRKYGRFNALDTIYTPPGPPKPGMVLVKPTSITHSGTSATLGANGQVTFSAVTSLSLNGVFTADFDNYAVVIAGSPATSEDLVVRLRAAGSDNSTANSYVFQQLDANSTTVTGARTTTTRARLVTFYTDVAANGATSYFYGPFLAQPTAYRSVVVSSSGSARIQEYAGTHNQSVSYDGLTIFGDNTLAFTGKLAVYGVRS